MTGSESKFDPVEKGEGVESEISPETKELIEKEPALGQAAMLEAAENLIQEGDKESLETAQEIIDSTKVDIIDQASQDENKPGKVKSVFGNLKRSLVLGGKDSRVGLSPSGNLKNIMSKFEGVEGGKDIKGIYQAAVKVSGTYGVVRLADDVIKGMKGESNKDFWQNES